MAASPHTFFLSARTVALSYGNFCFAVQHYVKLYRVNIIDFIEKLKRQLHAYNIK